MAISTGQIGIDPSNNEVHLYSAGDVTVLPPGTDITVEWGAQVMLAEGDALAINGVYMIVGGAPIQATGPCLVIPVTITGSAP